jgi:hypothetical protein
MKDKEIQQLKNNLQDEKEDLKQKLSSKDS